MNDQSPPAIMLRESRDAATLILTLDYPHRRNALAMPMRRQMIDAIERAEIDPGVRAIVITGAGAHFSAGGDISSMDASDIPGGRARMAVTHRLVRGLLKGSKPVLVAIEGWCAGVGRTRQMLLYGEAIEAAEALRIGLVDQLVPAGTALQAALARARLLHDAAPLPIAYTRQYLAQGLDAALDWERDIQATLFLSADHAEGKAAFLEKRAPKFLGR
jgi:2-(1,2-epoxy-1,2-dihydrophenyl)acetyl-CoA isomerase